MPLSNKDNTVFLIDPVSPTLFGNEQRSIITDSCGIQEEAPSSLRGGLATVISPKEVSKLVFRTLVERIKKIK
jgi:UDP-N-acetylglucosamine 2-epimerase